MVTIAIPSNTFIFITRQVLILISGVEVVVQLSTVVSIERDSPVELLCMYDRSNPFSLVVMSANFILLAFSNFSNVCSVKVVTNPTMPISVQRGK